MVISGSSRIEYIIVFLLIFLSGSFVVSNDIISSFATIALWLVTFVLCMLNNKFSENKATLVTILLAMTLFVSNLVNGEFGVVTFNHLFSIFASLLVVKTMSSKSFALIYTRIIKIICVISLVGYSAIYFVPSVFSHFIVTNSVGSAFSNYWLYVASLPFSFFNRNYGMYWEPGAFSAFISLGFMLDTYYLRNSKALDFFIYIVTIITTFSTTGIIAIMLMSLYLVVNKSIFTRGTRYLMLGFIALALLFAAIYPELFFSSSGESAFGKFQAYQGGDDTGTVAIRVYAIEYGIKGFLQNPLLGCGIHGLENLSMNYTNGHNVCTFINWFAFFGLFFGIIMCTGFLNFSSMIAKGRTTSTLFVFLMFFIITISENMATNAVFFVIALYGYSHKKESIQLMPPKDMLKSPV